MSHLAKWITVSAVAHLVALTTVPLVGTPTRAMNAEAHQPQLVALTLTAPPQALPKATPQPPSTPPTEAPPEPTPLSEPVPAPIKQKPAPTLVPARVPAPLPPPKPAARPTPSKAAAHPPPQRPTSPSSPSPVLTEAAAVAPAPPSPPVIPAPAASPPIVFTPKFLSPPLPPDYPSSAVRRHLQGVVIVRALVSRPGRPDEIVIWRSSGHGVLDAAAEQAVSAWKFVPSHQGGVAVTAWVEVPVVFQLN